MIKVREFVVTLDGELIAVICIGHVCSFEPKLKQAIGEHFVTDEVTILTDGIPTQSEFEMGISPKEIDIKTIEDGEECLRRFDLTETVRY